jgi:hypothetical protein
MPLVCIAFLLPGTSTTRCCPAQKKTGLADVSAAFRQAGIDQEARLSLYCRDKTHLSPRGHALAADTVLDAIVEGASESDESGARTTGGRKKSGDSTST